MKDIEKELKELRDKQDKGKATLEQSLTDNAVYLQEQVSKRTLGELRLRAVVLLVGPITWLPVVVCAVQGTYLPELLALEPLFFDEDHTLL